MGAWYPSATTVRGIRDDINERLIAYPARWPRLCKTNPSSTQVEPYAWPKAVPEPRKMEDGRKIQGLGEVTYNVENEELELSIKIDRKTFEDQQTQQVRQKIDEVVAAWGPFKDKLFTQLVEAGGGTTLGTPYDGNAFFHDTREDGASGAIDNNLTSVAAANSAIPTPTELLDALNDARATMMRYKDNVGRQGVNAAAAAQLVLMYPPDLMRPVLEALNATQISNTDNVFGRGLAEPLENPYLTVDATPTKTIFVAAMGQMDFTPFIYQERTPLEYLVYGDPHWLDFNNGLLITLRQRFKFAYGNFRRCARHVFTT